MKRFGNTLILIARHVLDVKDVFFLSQYIFGDAEENCTIACKKLSAFILDSSENTKYM